jgi:pimeloyl-ACP methyl ester carboxylesterase
MLHSLVTIEGSELVGELYHNGSKDRLIVICHGFNSSSSNPTLVDVREGLNKKGHNTFTFNFSENIGGFDIEHQVQDVDKVIQYFADFKDIIVLASSFAALTASITAIDFPGVKGLITINGFFGYFKLGKKYRKNYLKFRIAALAIPKYRRIFKYYKRKLQPSHITVPVLVIHSLADEDVHIIQSRRFYNKLTVARQFIALKTADHGLRSSVDRNTVINNINDWLLRMP